MNCKGLKKLQAVICKIALTVFLLYTIQKQTECVMWMWIDRGDPACKQFLFFIFSLEFMCVGLKSTWIEEHDLCVGVLITTVTLSWVAFILWSKRNTQARECHEQQEGENHENHECGRRGSKIVQHIYFKLGLFRLNAAGTTPGSWSAIVTLQGSEHTLQAGAHKRVWDSVCLDLLHHLFPTLEAPGECSGVNYVWWIII
jgi:hypothetical protein